MAGCCGGASCACVVSAGTGVTVSGTGTPANPFVIGSDRGLTVTDNAVFDLTLTGTGTAASPWNLQVAFAATAKLTNIPDVNAAAPTNGQVLGWDSATSKWTARAPTTAASGSVLHDTSMTGDGSAGTPLGSALAAGRGLQSTGGLGLTDAFINQMVRRFTDTVARSTATPTPVLNSLSMLDSAPGQLTYWDGSQWSSVLGPSDVAVLSPEMLALSGPYSSQRRTEIVKAVSAITDASGIFDILTPADLSGRGGVLICQFQEGGFVAPFKAMVYANTDRISGIAYNMVGGAPMASQVVGGWAYAWVY